MFAIFQATERRWSNKYLILECRGIVREISFVDVIWKTNIIQNPDTKNNFEVHGKISSVHVWS